MRSGNSTHIPPPLAISRPVCYAKENEIGGESMAIHFSKDRMAQVLENHDRWWRGELGQPLVKVFIENAYPAENCGTALLSQENCTDFTISPEQIIDAFDHSLSRMEYLGDAFPMVSFDSFGPGVLAAFCGAELDNSSGRVWFFPKEELPIEDIHVRYDPENIYARRIKQIYRAGLEKWEGSVILGLPDLGGVMDVAATLRGSENLLLDLYDEPEEVLRLNQEIQTAWYDAYNDFSQVLAPQKCYTDWNGILSSQPSYVLQCDFCYMISNPMFRQFVLETLREDTQRLTNTIYHLDGIGQLNHLDDLLSLENLRAVQWVPGMGKAPTHEWMDVYKKIQAAGKHSMIIGDPESYFAILNEVHGTPFCAHSVQATQLDLAQKLINAR
jgi:5-methyltetrahydrofolate--homocysteine methyltransferase